MKHIACLLALLFLAACAAPSAATSTSTFKPTPTRAPARHVLISAYRGGMGLGPEDMLSTFRMVLNYIPDYLQLDVHLTKDGIPVVFHDATLERICTHVGPLSNYTFTDLTIVNCALSKSYGERIPRLGDALDLVKYSNTELEIEIHVGADGKPYPGIEQQVLNEVAARDLMDHVKIMASEFETLKRVRAVNPTVRTEAVLTADYVRRMDVDKPSAILDDVAAYNVNQIAVDKDALTQALTQEAHNRKMLVSVWTVDDESEMQKFISMGVDSITTGRPDLLVQLLRR